MKHIFLYLLSFIVCFAAARAEKGLRDTSITGNTSGTPSKSLFASIFGRTSNVSQGCVRLQFASNGDVPENKDSALVIFDRYNRTGAGVIFNVFVQDKNHSIVISKVPAGKYFVTIQCMGLHHDRVEKVITVHAKKGKSITLQLEDSEQFSKEKVVIPAYKPDLMSLENTKTR